MKQKIAPVEKGLKKIREESKNLQKEVRVKAVTYITAALALVAGLAWNEAIKSLIEYLFPLNQNTMAAKFVYAALITVILVFTTAYILREPKKEKD